MPNAHDATKELDRLSGQPDAEDVYVQHLAGEYGYYGMLLTSDAYVGKGFWEPETGDYVARIEWLPENAGWIRLPLIVTGNADSTEAVRVELEERMKRMASL